MADKQKDYDQISDPHSGRPPRPLDVEKTRKKKTLGEWNENEDLEVDENSAATAGNPESPFNTGAVRKVANRESGLDDGGDNDEVDPAAIDEEMRNQDS